MLTNLSQCAEYSHLIHTAFSLALASLGQTVMKEAYAVTASLQP